MERLRDAEVPDHDHVTDAHRAEHRRQGLVAHLALLRPRHWVKNVFVLIPLLLAGSLASPTAILDALAAAGLFTVAACAVYVFNDLQDAEADRRHPIKRYTRPIAAGEVSRRQARRLLAGLVALLAAGGLLEPLVIAPIGAYLAINLAYSVYLKRVPVVDVFCVASGFGLRVYAGAIAIGVAVPPWLVAAVVCLAASLAVTKRRREQAAHGPTGRTVLDAYSQEGLVDGGLLAAIGALACYTAYLVTARPELWLTLPLVLVGLVRYRFLVEARGHGEAPVRLLLRDRPLAATVTGWIGAATLAIWIG